MKKTNTKDHKKQTISGMQKQIRETVCSNMNTLLPLYLKLYENYTKSDDEFYSELLHSIEHLYDLQDIEKRFGMNVVKHQVLLAMRGMFMDNIHNKDLHNVDHFACDIMKNGDLDFYCVFK
jgi:hypothetical protein